MGSRPYANGAASCSTWWRRNTPSRSAPPRSPTAADTPTTGRCPDDDGALAGLAVELAGTGPAVLLIAAGFAGSAGYLTRIGAADPRPASAGRSRLSGKVRDGTAYVLRHPVLRVLALAGGAHNMLALVLQTMVPVRLVSELGASPATASAYFSAGGAGGSSAR